MTLRTDIAYLTGSVRKLLTAFSTKVSNLYMRPNPSSGPIPSERSISMFDERKTAQLAAFLLKHGGGRMEYIKIIKLLYLAEREHLNRYHSPMTGDKLYSLGHGPVLSITYNCIKKDAGYTGETWHEWISEKDGYCISLRRDFNDHEDLDELSEADLEILTNTWNQFGWMGWRQLVRYTHNNCAEWKHPGKTSTPIKYDEVLKALGYEPDMRAQIVASIAENFSNNNLAATQ